MPRQKLMHIRDGKIQKMIHLPNDTDETFQVDYYHNGAVFGTNDLRTMMLGEFLTMWMRDGGGIIGTWME